MKIHYIYLLFPTYITDVLYNETNKASLSKLNLLLPTLHHLLHVHHWLNIHLRNLQHPLLRTTTGVPETLEI